MGLRLLEGLFYSHNDAMTKADAMMAHQANANNLQVLANLLVEIREISQKGLFKTMGMLKSMSDGLLLLLLQTPPAGPELLRSQQELMRSLAELQQMAQEVAEAGSPVVLEGAGVRAPEALVDGPLLEEMPESPAGVHAVTAVAGAAVVVGALGAAVAANGAAVPVAMAGAGGAAAGAFCLAGSLLQSPELVSSFGEVGGALAVGSLLLNPVALTVLVVTLTAVASWGTYRLVSWLTVKPTGPPTPNPEILPEGGLPEELAVAELVAELPAPILPAVVEAAENLSAGGEQLVLSTMEVLAQQSLQLGTIMALLLTVQGLVVELTLLLTQQREMSEAIEEIPSMAMAIETPVQEVALIPRVAQLFPQQLGE